MKSVCETQVATEILSILPHSHQIQNLILRVGLKERFHHGINSVWEIQAATRIVNILPNSHHTHDLILKVVLRNVPLQYEECL